MKLTVLSAHRKIKRTNQSTCRHHPTMESFYGASCHNKITRKALPFGIKWHEWCCVLAQNVCSRSCALKCLCFHKRIFWCFWFHSRYISIVSSTEQRVNEVFWVLNLNKFRHFNIMKSKLYLNFSLYYVYDVDCVRVRMGFDVFIAICMCARNILVWWMCQKPQNTNLNNKRQWLNFRWIKQNKPKYSRRIRKKKRTRKNFKNCSNCRLHFE